ncbi:RHS repeat-associated protein [Chitinophaga sp. S165]|nr:RHS repeat-associated protein [Chitinophaga sp. S165]
MHLYSWFLRNRTALLATLLLILKCFDTQAQNVPNGATAPVVNNPVVPSSYNAAANFPFIRQWTPSIPVTDLASVVSSARTNTEVQQTTTYFDGLGRKIQTVLKGATPGGRDMVSLSYYDDAGRQTRQYLSYATLPNQPKDGLIKLNPFADQVSFYNGLPGQEQQKYLYSSSQVENSSFSRPLQTFRPGNALLGNNVGQRYQYGVNNISEQIRIIGLADGPDLVPQNLGVFATGELYKTAVTDEDNKITIEYKTRDGRSVLKKHQVADNPGSGAQGWLCTYYVYDDLGGLRLIVTPKAVKAYEANGWNFQDAQVLENLCFQVKYDAKGREVEKKAGGAEPEYLVYDLRERLTFIQDGNQRKDGKWIVMFYDDFDRLVMTAEYKSGATRAQLQQRMDTIRSTAEIPLSILNLQPADLTLQSGEVSAAEYTASNSITVPDGFSLKPGDDLTLTLDTAKNLTNSLPSYLNPVPELESFTPITIYHYDDYTWAGAKPFRNEMVAKLDASGASYVEAALPDYNLTGVMTGKQTRVINAATEQWLTTTAYYDSKGRRIQLSEDNINGGTDVTTSQYQFSGQLLSQHLLHNNPLSKTTPSLSVLTKYLYDNNGRLIKTTQTLNNDHVERLVSQLAYDTLGRLRSKKLGNLDELVYDYDLNSKIIAVNRDYVRNGGNGYFGYEMFYEHGFSNSWKNGSLSGITWRRKGDNGYRSFGYNYDPAGRLSQADFALNKDGTWSSSNENYGVSNLTYDLNGNIQTMDVSATLLGATKPVDKLRYTYESVGDKLLKVIDDAGFQQQGDFKDGLNGENNDYTYDSDGNLISDENKGTHYTWNSTIGKLVKIALQNSQKSIEYTYDASGFRWKKDIIDGNSRTSYSYLNGFVYKNDTLLFFSHPEGRIRRTAKGQLVYDYFETDNLGNVRTVLTEEKDTSFYAATFEQNRSEIEVATYRNLDLVKEAISTQLPWYNEQTNKYWSRLNGSVPDKKIGAAIVLKVMAGDVVDIQTKAYYKTTGTTNTATPDDIVNNLITAFLGAGSEIVDNGKGNIRQNGGSYLNTGDLYAFVNDNQQNNQTNQTPKAYLNYLLFDENFNLVTGYVKRINGGPDALTSYNGHIDVPKNGFVYVYTSNEGSEDVWFDDLQVSHQSGPLLQESTVYPYGLEITTQSSRRLNKTGNQFLFQSKELDQELDVALYYFNARYYDPQLGRFISLDPARQLAGGYNGMGNNPAMFVDPDGRFLPLVAVIAGAVIGGVTNVISNWSEISSAPTLGQAILRGASYTLVGAVSGGLYATGNVTAAATISAIGNGVADVLSGHSINDAAGRALMGTIMAPIGGAVTRGASTVIGPLVSRIPGDAIRTAIDIGVSQAIGAEVMGTASGMWFGNQSLGEAMKNALPSALVAGASGSISGYINGYIRSRTTNRDPVNETTVGNIEKVETVQATSEVSTDLEGPASKGTWNFRSELEDNAAKLNIKTSAKGDEPSKVYTIYDKDGQIIKFGVTDAELKRLNDVLRYEVEAGATPRVTDKVFPKFEAHIIEKYLRSLYYNSGNTAPLPGMKVPYPRDFNTGKMINPKN